MSGYRKYLFSGIILCCVSLTILNMSKIAQEKQKQITTASWSLVYESADMLINDADIIIRGELIEEIPELRNDMVFTYERIVVTEVYKGDVSAGEILDVLQTGGDYGSVSTPSIDEAPLFSEVISTADIKETEFILCLKQTEYDDLYGSYYLICGGFQGVGIINEYADTEIVVSLINLDDAVIDGFTLSEIEIIASEMNVE